MPPHGRAGREPWPHRRAARSNTEAFAATAKSKGPMWRTPSLIWAPARLFVWRICVEVKVWCASSIPSSRGARPRNQS